MSSEGAQDKVEGKAKEFGGKAEYVVGNVTGDDEMKAKGKAHQTEGKAQGLLGKVKDVAKDAADTVKDKFDEVTGKTPEEHAADR